jgi:hypothetical protein
MQPGATTESGKTGAAARTSRVASLGGPVNAGISTFWRVFFSFLFLRTTRLRARTSPT